MSNELVTTATDLDNVVARVNAFAAACKDLAPKMTRDQRLELRAAISRAMCQLSALDGNPAPAPEPVDQARKDHLAEVKRRTALETAARRDEQRAEALKNPARCRMQGFRD